VRLRILSLLLLLPKSAPFGWEVVQLVGLQTLEVRYEREWVPCKPGASGGCVEPHSPSTRRAD